MRDSHQGSPLVQSCMYPGFGSPDSPRTCAHFAIIQALTTHDAELLQQALGQAREAGIPNSTLEPVDRAMAALGGYVACGHAAYRREVAHNLEKATKLGNEKALKEALLEAIEYRVEEGFVQAERALVAARHRKSRVLDRLVAVMEECAESAEFAMSQKTAGCTPKNLVDLKQALDEAKLYVDHGDEIILCASRMLAFETGRINELAGLENKLREHVSTMEHIVDTLQNAHPRVPAETADIRLDAALPIRGSETYARTVTAAMDQVRDLQKNPVKT